VVGGGDNRNSFFSFVMVIGVGVIGYCYGIYEFYSMKKKA
jgi:hypothetical protein